MAIPHNSIFQFKAFLADFMRQSREEFFEENGGPFLILSVKGEPPKLLDLGVVKRHGLETIEFGRSTKSDLSCIKQDISTRHAKVEIEQGKWSVVDLGSTNGTFAQDRLTPNYPRFLENGMTVQLGQSIQFQFWEKTRLFDEIRTRKQQLKQQRTLKKHSSLQDLSESLTKPRSSRQMRPVNVKLPRPLIQFALETKTMNLKTFTEHFQGPFFILFVATRSRNISAADDTIDNAEIARHRGLSNLRYWMIGNALRSTEMTFGRSQACDLILSHHTVSKIHARLNFDQVAGSWVLKDLGSHNGLWVDGEQVEEVKLQDEMAFRFGTETELQFMRSKTFHDFARLFRLSQKA